MTTSVPGGYRSPVHQDPLLAPFEIPMGHPLGCDHYTPRGAVMGGLYVAAQFELANLATFHRAALETAKRQDDAVTRYAAALNAEPPSPLFNDDDRQHWAELMDSRARTAILDADSQIAAIVAYANELCIIGLWAHTEKHLDGALTGMAGPSGEYRWDGFLRAFESAGIDIRSLPGFETADECRLLNNALKHGGVVSPALAAKTTFRRDLGKELRNLELHPQPYLLSVHHLIGSLLETCGARLEGGDHLRPWQTDSFGRPIMAR